MTRTLRLLGLLLAAIVLQAAIRGPVASAHHRPGPCDRHVRVDGHVSLYGEKSNARCAVGIWPVVGGFPKIARLFTCENGWGQDFSGPHYGPGQYLTSTWRTVFGEARRHLPWIRGGVNNLRGDPIATVRWIHFHGYGPWSGGRCA